MAKGLCSVKACEKSAKIAGMCGTHYHRMYRHGTTDETRASPGALLRFIDDVAVKHKDKKKCLIWPFKSKTVAGYAVVTSIGTTAHRVRHDPKYAHLTEN